MPVTTRSQKRASTEAIVKSIIEKSSNLPKSETICVPKSETTCVLKLKETPMNPSSWYIESLTTEWHNIVKCLTYGRAKTAEQAVLRKNGIVYRVAFVLKFKYDDSNGMEADEPEIADIFKTNEEDATENEKAFIIFLIKQQYNKITRCFY